MERVETVVIGGGQAGLAVGYHLSRQGREFVIVEAGHRLGDTWRSRWDSLRLFTPARFSHLPGLACPARHGRFHTKDEIADYLESYAAHFGIPVWLNHKVHELTKHAGRYLISAGERRIEAANVVVATGAFTAPYIPAFARQLSQAITQLHSTGYRNPDQLRAGAVLVVGAGSSGAEIALEVAQRHKTWLAGRPTGHVPFPLGDLAYRAMRRLSVDAWPGRAIAGSQTGRGHSLVSVRPNDLARAGIQRVPRVFGVEDGLPVVEGDEALRVQNVIWCTGFANDYRWIKLPIFDADGRPVHHRGVVTAEPGLFFIGLPFQASVASHLVGGVGSDAAYLVKRSAAQP
jgi:putative flavoprotein involved in K+ transport